VLYAMLSGRPPYPGHVPAAVLGRLLTESPPRLSSLDPAVPADLAAICEQAMARDPHARYASAAALARDLERYVGGERPAASAARRFPTRSRLA
jgi:serine/threonine protein kinase